MPISDDDDQFERYLKHFRPLPPEPLPLLQRRRTPGVRALGLWSLAAAMGITALVVLYPGINFNYVPTGNGRNKDKDGVSAVDAPPQVQRLTIGAANALLSKAPSLKVAIDGVAAQELQSQRPLLPDREHSALNVLGKEKTKL